MTLIQLEYIVAVDTHQHFGRAAEAVFVTQPTLSMQIHKLEDQLGVIIFDRAKQPIAPTEIGKRIIAQARMVLNEAKKIKELVSAEKGEITGGLNIGIIPTLSPYLLPLFINGFIENYPNLSVKVEEFTTDTVIRLLKDEKLDIGIIVTPYDDPDLITQSLFYEEFKAYVSHRSKFFEQGVVSAEEIEDNDIWLLNEGHCFRDQVLNICQTYKERNSRFKYESGSLEALKKIVDKHGGMTLLPELATIDFDKNSLAKLKPFTDPKPVREVSLVMKKSFLRHKLVEALHKEILDSIPAFINVQKTGEVIKWK